MKIILKNTEHPLHRSAQQRACLPQILSAPGERFVGLISGESMPKLGESYSTGKDGEKETWVYLEEYGFFRPSQEHRNLIAVGFERQGIKINKRGFDVVHKNDLQALTYKTPECLYEVKSCGAKRGQSIFTGFKGLGFTLTQAEKDNAERLGDAYKFIFVNIASREHLILDLRQFFDEKVSRIYPTWSIFIKTSLTQSEGSIEERILMT